MTNTKPARPYVLASLGRLAAKARVLIAQESGRHITFKRVNPRRVI
jgi:hypothetical protein